MKSGYAIAAALRGPASAPGVVARRVVELSDPACPETRQPYHDGFYKQEDDPREMARRLKIVKRCAKQSVEALFRAHASEGQLFRTVLADALRSHGIACDVTVEKTLAEKAVKGLRRTDAEIRRTLASLGKTLGGTWRSEEKAACAAAWLALT